MARVRIFEHGRGEGPGFLGEVLSRRGIARESVRAHEGAAIASLAPEDLALVFMGGPMSANDPLPWIEQELGLIRAALARAVPVLGVCLGAQLVARAAGGVVHGDTVPEIGWFPVQRAPGDAGRAWLGSLPDEFEVFHWHAETFTLPPGAERILSSRDCANQAFVLGPALGLQCHIEMTAAMVRKWAPRVPADLRARYATVASPEEMCARLDQRIAALNRAAEIVLDRFLAQITT